MKVSSSVAIAERMWKTENKQKGKVNLYYYCPITTSISVTSPSTCEENNSAPEARESISSASLPVPRLGSYCKIELVNSPGEWKVEYLS